MQTQVATRFETGTFRILLAATMIALMPAAAWPATPQDEARPRWFGDRFDSMTILAYGIPDSDYVALSFGCEPGAAVSVGVQDEASDAKERSEERRVGNECVSKWRARWSPTH